MVFSSSCVTPYFFFLGEKVAYWYVAMGPGMGNDLVIGLQIAP